MPTEIGCFISPHGYGHATRSIAVLEALHDLVPNLHPHIFTTVQEGLFSGAAFASTYHQLQCDVGLIHSSDLAVDPDRSRAALSRTIPYGERLLDEYAEICNSFQLIYCDISTFGIEVAARCGVPSLLVENFTWDWIYGEIAQTYPPMSAYAELFSRSYAKVDYRIQAEPLCRTVPCDLVAPPIARKTRGKTAGLDRHFRELDSPDRPLILITMGGISLELPFLHLLEKYQEYLFIIAGQKENAAPGNNIRLLGNDTALHHPDLIDSVDLVLCKSGYSTIAECAQTSTPVCCVKRADFPESAILESYVLEHLHGVLLEFPDFIQGNWLADLPSYLKNRREPIGENGADQAAAFIHQLLKEQPR